MHKLRLWATSAWAPGGLAVLLLAASALEVLVVAPAHPVQAFAWSAALAATVSVCRTRPLAAIGAAAALLALPIAPHTAGWVVGGLLVPIALCVSAGAHAPGRRALVAVIVLVVALQVHVGFGEGPNFELLALTLPAWWIGTELRRRRWLVDELAARTRALEAEEEVFVQLSLERERARIARDLHDIVSHHLAVMAIQAGAGRLAPAWHDDIDRARTEAIRDAGEQALAETHRLVRVLRSADGAPPRLDELLDRCRTLGARITAPARAVDLPPEAEAAVYRVLQEAMTNALKHAPGAPIEISVARGSEDLAIRVANGPTATATRLAATGSGSGLRGMRERLSVVGGSLTAGPRDDGGFELAARVPCRSGQ